MNGEKNDWLYVIGSIASILGLIIIIIPALIEYAIDIPTNYKIILFFFLLALLIFSFSRILRLWKGKTPISIKEDHILYTIKESSGKLVTCEKNQFIRANVGFITMYEEEIATDGKIRNFRGEIEGIDSNIISSSKKEGLKWKIRHVFHEPLPQNKYIKRTFSFDFINSFTQNDEYIWLDIRNDVKSFILSIIFPSNRFPKEVKKFLKREPAEMNIGPSLCPYTLPDGRTRVDWPVKHPKINDIYILRWNW